MCDGYFVSHAVIHFSVPQSTRQNVSAHNKAAEEVDVDEIKRVAKEAAESALDEEDGEELHKQGIWQFPQDLPGRR